MTPTPRPLVLLFWLSLSPSAAAVGQDPPKLTHELLIERGPQLLLPPPAIAWIPGGHDAAFEIGDAIVRRAPGQAEPQPVLDAKTLLTRLGRAPRDGETPALPPWSFVDAGTLRLQLDDAIVHLPIAAGEPVQKLRWSTPDARDDQEPLAIAANDRAVAYVSGHDLWVADDQQRARRLTWDGGPDIVYGGAAHRAEFGITTGLFWSPDARRLAFYREDQREIAPYPYQDLDAMPPAPRHGRYPMAGRAHARVQVGVYDSHDQSLRWLEHDPAQDAYWTNVTFAADGASLTVAIVARGQDRLELVRFDCATGKRIATLLSESDAEWIEPEHGPHFLPDGRFLWWSSRDGHRHLWLHDQDGKALLQVTKGAFDVEALLAVTADRAGLWFAASGEDPRQRHLFFAKLDGTEVRQVTRDRGTHDCSLAPDGMFAFDVWSNLETPPQPRFLDLQTGATEALPAPHPPLLDLELPAQRLFQVKASDDTVLYGHLLLPKTIAEGEKLPVLLYVYGGPHVQQVTDSWLASASLWLHALANSGYVVCRLDNRGTPRRGIAFEQAVFRQLGTLEVEDQLRAVEWLKQQPFVDPARLGVHGWSFGGYLTLRLMLLSPGTFRCGISGAPVTDWAQYETGYTERYMDTPQENPDGYQKSSCLPLVDKLDGQLLVVHGTDDRTVMWSHTLAFVDRCIDAGKQLDYFPYPMQTHRLVGKDRVHFQKLLKAYLDEHLKAAK